MLDLPVVVFIIGMTMCQQKYNDNISIQFFFFFFFFFFFCFRFLKRRYDSLSFKVSKRANKSVFHM